MTKSSSQGAPANSSKIVGIADRPGSARKGSGCHSPVPFVGDLKYYPKLAFWLTFPPAWLVGDFEILPKRTVLVDIPAHLVGWRF